VVTPPAHLESVNLAHVIDAGWKSDVGRTGIDKRPAGGPVQTGADMLVGDTICDTAHHGGRDQAVYAYAREDAAWWAERLDRDVPIGAFGENLSTSGLDVTNAVIGERWRIGALELQVTVPRIPCGTFRSWIAERGWLRTFTRAAMPGTYLSVVRPGAVRAGDPVTVVHRPAHGVTVAQVFRAITLEPELLPSILAAEELPEETTAMASAGRTFTLG